MSERAEEGRVAAAVKKKKRKAKWARLGKAPGLEPSSAASELRLLRYDATGPLIKTKLPLADLPSFEATPTSWIRAVGSGSLKQLGERFGLHRLTLEDIQTSCQRSKFERFGEYDVLILSVPDEVEGSIQLALVIGDQYVLSVEEVHSSLLKPIRERISEAEPVICGGGPDRLAYVLLDLVIDRFFVPLGRIGEAIDQAEEQVLRADGKHLLPALHGLKQELRSLRRGVLPLREVVAAMARDEGGRIRQDTQVYLRDCSDHVWQLLELIDDSQATITELMDLHMSLTSNRMNEVMKVLTVISTIFLPLAFITGLYGMNFDTASPWNMPELRWPFGYFFALGLMALVVGSMFWVFWRRGWLMTDNGEE